MVGMSKLALTRWPNMTAFVGRLRLTPRQQPRTKLQARRGRGSVAIRSKIAIDVFSIFLYYDDDGDKKPISREGVIYEHLSAKIVLSQARRSRASHRMHSSLAKARFGPADIYPFPYPLFKRINCDFYTGETEIFVAREWAFSMKKTEDGFWGQRTCSVATLQLQRNHVDF